MNLCILRSPVSAVCRSEYRLELAAAEDQDEMWAAKPTLIPGPDEVLDVDVGEIRKSFRDEGEDAKYYLLPRANYPVQRRPLKAWGKCVRHFSWA